MMRLTMRMQEEETLNRAILLSLRDAARPSAGSGGVSGVRDADVDTLCNMGFTRDMAVTALRESGGDVEIAADRLLNSM